MNADQARELVFWVGGAVGTLLLYSMVWEVNAKLKQQGNRPITAREFGLRFFNRVLQEHRRLFPLSRKTTLLVLVFGFIVAWIIWMMAAPFC